MPSGLDGTGGNNKKHRKHTSHSVADSPAYSTAVQECLWAVEEYEMQLRDPCGDLYSMEDEEEEEEEDAEASLSKYSFAILAQPPTNSQQYHRDSTAEETDDEGEALYATQGLIDVTVEGRKRFLALTALAKRQREAATRKEKAGQIKREKAAAGIKSKKSKYSVLGGSVSSITKKATITDSITPTAIPAESEVGTSTKKRKAASGGGKTEKHEQQLSNKRPNLDKAKHSVSITSKGAKRRSNIIPDKKSRACAKVRAYVTKLIQKGLVIPNAAHPATVGSGASGAGNSHHSVDTSGFLGMALAFRAAAGEIPGVAPIDEADVRPWDSIDITESKTPQERRSLLKQKIELIQTALNALENENRRREQILESILRRKQRDGSIIPTVLDNAYDKDDVAVIPSTEQTVKAAVSLNGSLSHSTGAKSQQKKESILAAVGYGTAKDETNSSPLQEEYTSSESDAETEDDDSQGIQW